MLRQIYIYHNQKPIFSYALALALGGEEFKQVISFIEPDMILPTPGQTLHRAVSKFQIFHRSYGNSYFLIIVDRTDSFEYVNDILLKIVNKFKDLFENPEDIMMDNAEKSDFIKFLYDIQKDLHSKISIVGPTDSGKTTLYNLLKSGQEKKIMDFANATIFEIDNLGFDLWDFILKDNFSLLWPKFIGGSDLVILLFDSKDYGPKLIQYFVNLIEQNAPNSKLVIIANKAEHISDEELEHIKNSINIKEIKKLSMIEPEIAKKELDIIMKEVLNLKRDLPLKYENLIKEAQKLDSENNLSEAITKYEELIQICHEYQDFTHLEYFQSKLATLKKKLEEYSNIKSRMETSKTFVPPEKIKFTRKVSVKTLPRASEILKPSTSDSSIQSSSGSLERSPSIMRSQTMDQPSKIRKLSLKPEDIKIDLKAKIEKIQQIKNLEPKKIIQKIQKVDIISKIQPREIIQKIKSKEESKPSTISEPPISVNQMDFSSRLQTLIINSGSSLERDLCEFFIEELSAALNSPITYKDLELAAELFYKIEKDMF